MPRVNFENFIDFKMAGLYSSRVGSTDAFINSDAACSFIIVIYICVYDSMCVIEDGIQIPD